MITATTGDVRAGKVIVDKDGEPLTGVLPDRGSWSSFGLAAGASVVIPAGIHDGTGRVTAKSLAEQTPGTLVADKMLVGTYGYSGGKRIDGSIKSLSGQTVTPGNAKKTVSCNGKYMTGDVTVLAVAGLTPGNIKKGVTVGGVTGTWEGYVSSTDDVYNHGIWGFGGYLVPLSNGSPTLQSDRIDLSVPSGFGISTVNNVDFKRYSKLTIEGSNLTKEKVYLYASAGSYGTNFTSLKQALIPSTAITSDWQTFTFSSGYVSQLYINFRPDTQDRVSERYIYKITLS